MSDLFQAADMIILSVEKEHSADPNDPGGDTWWGLARRWHPNETPWPPTFERAQQVRRAEYWDAHGCGAMPWQWALAVYDGAVNQGAAVVRMAQQALGVPQDGVAGPRTAAAMAAAQPDCLRQFLALRALRYTMEPQFGSFGRGWLARLFMIAQLGAAPPAADAGNLKEEQNNA